MVIGQISGIASLVVILVFAGLFLRQAAGSSIGTAGKDVGVGLTGVSEGIDALINSIFSPISTALGGFSSFIQNPFGANEQDNRSQNNYGYIRSEPAENTSRQNSGIAQHTTITHIDRTRPSSGVSFTSSGHSGNWSGGGFRAAN